MTMTILMMIYEQYWRWCSWWSWLWWRRYSRWWRRCWRHDNGSTDATSWIGKLAATIPAMQLFDTLLRISCRRRWWGFWQKFMVMLVIMTIMVIMVRVMMSMELTKYYKRWKQTEQYFYSRPHCCPSISAPLYSNKMIMMMITIAIILTTIGMVYAQNDSGFMHKRDRFQKVQLRLNMHW